MGCCGAEAAPAGRRLLGDSWAGVRQPQSRTTGGGHLTTWGLTGKGWLDGDKEPIEKGEKDGGVVCLVFSSPPPNPPKKKQECGDRFIRQLEARKGTWGLTGEWDTQMKRGE